MSRAALVLICDFLLISLLSLASFDQAARQQPEPAAGGVDAQAVTNLIEIMQQALEQERSARSATLEELAQAQEALKNREELLQSRETQVREQEENLSQMEERARQLAEERARLQQQAEASQQELADLESQQAEAQNRIQRLNEDLRVTSAEASITRNQAETIRTELAARRAEVEKLQDKIENLEAVRQNAESEKQRFAVELARVQTEATIVREQLSESREQVRTLNVEKAELRETTSTLARGVDSLAEQSQALNTNLVRSMETLTAKSDEIKDEIKAEIAQTQVAAPNTIYRELLTNRVNSGFLARRTGFFGQSVKKELDTRTVLFQAGSETFALFHLEDTPLGLWSSGSDWETMTGSLGRGLNHRALRELRFIGADPRVVLAPLPDNTATNLNVKIYPLAKDPYRYQTAIAIGTQQDYYGEVAFSLDPTNPVYLKMERQALGGLFSGSLPSRGDLIFTKQGELLGLMVNDEYCVVLQQLAFTRSVRLGPEITDQKTSEVVGELWSRIQGLPMKMQ